MHRGVRSVFSLLMYGLLPLLFVAATAFWIGVKIEHAPMMFLLLSLIGVHMLVMWGGVAGRGGIVSRSPWTSNLYMVSHTLAFIPPSRMESIQTVTRQHFLRYWWQPNLHKLASGSEDFNPHSPAHEFQILLVATMTAISSRETLTRAVVLFAFAAIAFFGRAEHAYYYCFCLFDIIFMNDIMRNIMNAIVVPGKSLLSTFAILSIVVYAFALTAYFLFEKSYLTFSLDAGGDMISFFFVSMYNIMVPGPAMAIATDPQFHQRFAFDILFML